MKYWVIERDNYGTTVHEGFATKEEALQHAAANTTDEAWCEVIEGREVKFKIIKTAVEE